MSKFSHFCILVILFQATLDGDINKELNKFFDSFGASANVSSADVYQGQKAGYGTGGSLTIRNRVLTSKIATINLPKIDAGCGGIDLYAGGFSFISDQKLVENLKNIAAASAGYAFFLGIETVSPQISNQLKTLQSWANTINGMGINSCEIASQLVGSVWPRNEIASQHICKSFGNQQGLNMSYLQPKYCSTKKEAETVFKEVNEKHPNLLQGDYNLAWKAIQQQSAFSGQTDLAELLMTITGTVVSKDGEKKFFPSRITNQSFLKSLLEGGEGFIYRCENRKQCLTVREDNIIFSAENSWTGKVQSNLISIQGKILNEEELSNSEIAFLAISSLPLYKIVNVLTAHKHGACPIDLINIADIVAVDMLMQCLREGLEVIRAGCTQLRNDQMYATEIDDYIKNLDRIENEIKFYETRAMRKLEAEMEIMKKIQMLEEQIAIELNL